MVENRAQVPGFAIHARWNRARTSQSRIQARWAMATRRGRNRRRAAPLRRRSSRTCRRRRRRDQDRVRGERPHGRGETQVATPARSIPAVTAIRAAVSPPLGATGRARGIRSRNPTRAGRRSPWRASKSRTPITPFVRCPGPVIAGSWQPGALYLARKRSGIPERHPLLVAHRQPAGLALGQRTLQVGVAPTARVPFRHQQHVLAEGEQIGAADRTRVGRRLPALGSPHRPPAHVLGQAAHRARHQPETRSTSGRQKRIRRMITAAATTTTQCPRPISRKARCRPKAKADLLIGGCIARASRLQVPRLSRAAGAAPNCLVGRTSTQRSL